MSLGVLGEDWERLRERCLLRRPREIEGCVSRHMLTLDEFRSAWGRLGAIEGEMSVEKAKGVLKCCAEDNEALHGDILMLASMITNDPSDCFNEIGMEDFSLMVWNLCTRAKLDILHPSFVKDILPHNIREFKEVFHGHCTSSPEHKTFLVFLSTYWRSLHPSSLVPPIPSEKWRIEAGFSHDDPHHDFTISATPPLVFTNYSQLTMDCLMEFFKHPLFFNEVREDLLEGSLRGAGLSIINIGISLVMALFSLLGWRNDEKIFSTAERTMDQNSDTSPKPARRRADVYRNLCSILFHFDDIIKEEDYLSIAQESFCKVFLLLFAIVVSVNGEMKATIVELDELLKVSLRTFEALLMQLKNRADVDRYLVANLGIDVSNFAEEDKYFKIYEEERFHIFPMDPQLLLSDILSSLSIQFPYHVYNMFGQMITDFNIPIHRIKGGILLLPTGMKPKIGGKWKLACLNLCDPPVQPISRKKTNSITEMFRMSKKHIASPRKASKCPPVEEECSHLDDITSLSSQSSPLLIRPTNIPLQSTVRRKISLKKAKVQSEENDENLNPERKKLKRLFSNGSPVSLRRQHSKQETEDPMISKSSLENLHNVSLKFQSEASTSGLLTSTIDMEKLNKSEVTAGDVESEKVQEEKPEGLNLAIKELASNNVKLLSISQDINLLSQSDSSVLSSNSHPERPPRSRKNSFIGSPRTEKKQKEGRSPRFLRRSKLKEKLPKQQETQKGIEKNVRWNETWNEEKTYIPYEPPQSPTASGTHTPLRESASLQKAFMDEDLRGLLAQSSEYGDYLPAPPKLHLPSSSPSPLLSSTPRTPPPTRSAPPPPKQASNPIPPSSQPRSLRRTDSTNKCSVNPNIKNAQLKNSLQRSFSSKNSYRSAPIQEDQPKETPIRPENRWRSQEEESLLRSIEDNLYRESGYLPSNDPPVKCTEAVRRTSQIRRSESDHCYWLSRRCASSQATRPPAPRPPPTESTSAPPHPKITKPEEDLQQLVEDELEALLQKMHPFQLK
eukprot:TRINITY_DN11518_c1_g4_i1.p1 TRINITY_DN11518_c1_g4~~TRINITY_DN11518_c1_g4_i1.p1  ORF type:complete len:1013 (-),score=303.14 TRINITY_DN11518_c1_g4_i1:432-3470(-)